MRAFFKKPLVIATLIACLCGLLKVGQPLDHIYWNVWFRLGQTEAPKSIVIVTLDNEAAWRSMPGADKARLLQKLAEQAPRGIYLDQPIDTDPTTDLSREIRALGDKITIVKRVDIESPKLADERIPDGAVIGNARIAYSGWYTNLMLFAQGAPYKLRFGGHDVPALASLLAGRKSDSTYFIPNFQIDPNSVRTVEGKTFLAGVVEKDLLTGRSIIVGSTRRSPESQIGYFGHGYVNPVMLDIAGAAAIARGDSVRLGDFPLLLLFIVGVMLAGQLRERKLRWTAYAVVAVTIVFGPAILQSFAALYVIPSTAILAMAFYAGIRIWAKWRRSVQQTSASGLPNFSALAEKPLSAGQDLVVATIGRYEEFLAMLPSHLHGECARQIARRFAVGSNAAQIYHGEGGHFAWVERAANAEHQSEHFEGLRALFSAPLLVGGHMFDTNVHFGIDRNSELDTLTRLNAALASANEALKSGQTIQQFEARRLADAPWELSLLARIDEGMKNGDIWLAYQPQWDYREGRLNGAEALVRWNDPERGPIRPDAFIVQAENAGRIDALTYWVMEEAISAAQAMNALGSRFQMSVNLSALLVDKPSLISAVSEISRRRGIDCSLFTIEVTETASVYNRPAAVHNLQQLRAMGFRLAIDDFGTGESSLLYLAELPSDELKIDQHFVSRIRTGERERQIVNSTIRLAHALRQTVVAEGIEDEETFEMLRRMGCDTGQGYYIARPGTFEQLRSGYLRGRAGGVKS